MILLHSKLSLLAQTASVMSSFLPPKKQFYYLMRQNPLDLEMLKKWRVWVHMFSYDNGTFCGAHLNSVAITVLLWGPFSLFLWEN